MRRRILDRRNLPPMFSIDLAQRLSRPGPRYTSYPTAAQFTPTFGSVAHADALKRVADEGSPLSLYVHIPFCQSLCHYCACHMQVTGSAARIQRYLDNLLEEIALVGRLLAGAGEVVQIHWGGGTPNSLNPLQIETLGAAIRNTFKITADAEASIECDPRTLVDGHLASAYRSGFRRVSLGVQTFDPMVQEAIGREQPFERVAWAVEAARTVGFTGINFDLLYGLPHQSSASIGDTVERTISLRPDRIALFGYAHVPWMKRHQRLIDVAALPNAEQRLRHYAAAYDALVAAGYVPIGIDHFALEDDPLATAQRDGTMHRNFQGYTTRAGTAVVGLGASSISSFGRAFAQNEKSLKKYYEAIDRGVLATERGLTISDDDIVRADIIERLMCGRPVVKAEVEARTMQPFDEQFADALHELKEIHDLGVVHLGEVALWVTAEGRPFARNVAMAFDAHRDTSSLDTPRYSQTV